MDALIQLKSGKEQMIYNIKEIKRICSIDDSAETIKDFKNFYLYSSFIYIFIGDEILTVHGSEIEYVKFQN